MTTQEALEAVPLHQHYLWLNGKALSEYIADHSQKFFVYFQCASPLRPDYVTDHFNPAHCRINVHHLLQTEGASHLAIAVAHMGFIERSPEYQEACRVIEPLLAARARQAEERQEALQSAVDTKRAAEERLAAKRAKALADLESEGDVVELQGTISAATSTLDSLNGNHAALPAPAAAESIQKETGETPAILAARQNVAAAKAIAAKVPKATGS